MKETQYPEKTAAEIKACLEAQVVLCNEKGFPHFAAPDGRCYACRYNVYQNYGSNKGRSGHELVTGCPHCHESFCE